MVGESKVGVSTLVHVLARGRLPTSELLASVGIDYRSVAIKTSNETTVRCSLWDVSDDPRTREWIPSFLRDTTVILAVYSSKRHATRQAAERWIGTVRAQHPARTPLVVILVDVDGDACTEAEHEAESAWAVRTGAYTRLAFRRASEQTAARDATAIMAEGADAALRIVRCMLQDGQTTD